MITPVGPGLTEEQSAFLDRALVQAGATFVPRLPRLVTRLGAPATGPTDLPLASPYDAAAPLRRFVSQLLAVRLRRIVEADLALRGGRGPIEHEAGVGRLAKEAARLRTELTGLSVLLDADWVEDLYDELGWITADERLRRAGEPGPVDGPAAQRALPDPAGATGRGGALAQTRRPAAAGDR